MCHDLILGAWKSFSDVKMFIKAEITGDGFSLLYA